VQNLSDWALSDWVIVGSAALVVGVTASFAGGAGGASGALLGSSTGVVLGAAISSKRQGDRDTDIKFLKQQVDQQNNLQKITAEIANLTPRVTELRRIHTELATVEGQFAQKQAELQQLEHRLTTLNQQRQELERRVTAINHHQPNLSNLEQLQKQIEQFRLDKSGLEGQIDALNSQIESLEEKKRSLQIIETEFSTKKTQLDAIKQEIQERQIKSQHLEQRAAELELLRATYDGIFSQKQSFEEIINQLRPEIDRLEAEKNRILQAIQENHLEYNKIEEFRQQLSGLKIQIKDKESQVRELEREIHHLNGVKASLEERNAQLRQEQKQLHDEIRRLKGEIDNLQNSAEVALRALKERLWLNLPDTKSVSPQEQIFLEKFTQDIHAQGLTFPQRVIHAFHTSLKVQDISALVILAGISGTGKSELPQKYANYIGAQLLTLAVQPRWDSPQDLQGFYNYVEKKFKPTDLMRGLYQYNHDPAMQDRMVIVLLDEMNLARVEYYFSDFLSKLEARRSHPTYLEIDVGSLPLKDTERRLKIPNEFLFVGTMNEDETTQTLSDKVLDRANVLTFGKPQNLQLRQQSHSQNTNTRPSGYLAYSDFRTWIKTPDANSQVVEKVKFYLDRVNQVMENMGHPFAHRVYQAITQYVVNYPGVENINSAAFKFAIADQFGQKILPKLRGVMIDEFTEELEQLKIIIAEINDQPLIAAFEKACAGRYGQFQWQGLIYQDEP
jgi:predicted  nucleic acid-binding Zn-ribbon protein